MGLPHYAKHDLQFYDHGCGGTFRVEDLGTLCVQRLQVLGLILRIVARNKNKTTAECRELLARQLLRRNLALFVDLQEGIAHEDRRAARERDNVSHNVLRLLLVQDDETRAWFLKSESTLFQWRVETLDAQGIAAFRAANDMTYPMLATEDKRSLRDFIAPLLEEEQYETTTIYAVPFSEVPKLLKERRVHVERGTAYITELQFRSLLSHHFERRLARMLQLSMGAKYYLNDTRMEFLGKRVRDIYESLRPIAVDGDEISIGDLNELSETSYPPCMRIIHEALESRSHLRNGGRVQYTLFLKSVGLNADDALEFYREIFTRKISPSDFEKSYAYQFRHMYGLVGTGKDYGNRECVRIAEESCLGPNDCHGCFFSNREIEDLGRDLERWQVPANHAREIARFAETKEYGRGCAAYFQALHGCAIPSPIVRPDDFFRQSRKMIKARNIGDCFFDGNADWHFRLGNEGAEF